MSEEEASDFIELCSPISTLLLAFRATVLVTKPKSTNEQDVQSVIMLGGSSSPQKPTELVPEKKCLLLAIEQRRILSSLRDIIIIVGLLKASIPSKKISEPSPGETEASGVLARNLVGNSIISKCIVMAFETSAQSVPWDWHSRSSHMAFVGTIDKDVVSSQCECTLCMCLMYQPVTTVCGHTFCRVCLAQALDHNNLCPFCRTSLSTHINPKRQPVNVLLRAAMRKWCQEEYNARHDALKADLKEQATYMPIFVCTLMFPGIPCPLHVFEPRYRLMVRRVLESNFKQFGMCISTTNGFSEIGTTAIIKSVRLMPDASYLVNCEGGPRFKVLEKAERDGYPVARVEAYNDTEAPAAGENLPALINLIRQVATEHVMPCLGELGRARLEQQIGPLPDTSKPTRFAYWLLNLLPFTIEKRYEFLLLRSELERYKVLHEKVCTLRVRPAAVDKKT